MASRFVVLALGLSISACSFLNEEKKFELLDSERTGILFNNLIAESDTLNVLGFEYIYNGGGVGVGDVNNDGLQDIFFAGNMVSCHLYINKGDFKFSDVTKEAGLSTSAWCTGVAMIDINQDGLLDIHIATINPHKDKSTPNLFFLNKGINQAGIPMFEEVADKIGLADVSYSTQAAFLDYDKDGDLDVYLVNNALEDYNRNAPIGQKNDGTGKSIDKLYRNEGTGLHGLPFFKDVSREAGILAEGWGLGVVVNDFNHDNYPDIYVSNDFLSNDHLFINNQNGTFTNKIADYLRHQEHNGMGIDIADINNDGLNDILVVDMMPDDNLRQKKMFADIGHDRFHLNLHQKYQPQYVRNVLQLNNGNGTFSDIGYLAGINATDWSWSALFADFDNDGHRDILITNGYRKDVSDLDFVTYSRESAIFGTDATRIKNATKAIDDLPGVKKANFVFKNNGDLTFSDKAPVWGLDAPSYSNGAAYADFDNDGDLDLVMNNINDKAFVYRNNFRKEGEAGSNFLSVNLKGASGNKEGIGVCLWLYYNGHINYAEHELQRGYKSTVSPIEHFGLGNAELIDSIKVRWPSGSRQIVYNVNVNQTISFFEKNAKRDSSHKTLPAQSFFIESHHKYRLAYKHDELNFVDYKQGQPLLPHKFSQGGPGVAVGDINGDDLDDLVIGGSAGKSATLFYQLPNGEFQGDLLPAKAQEDIGLLIFDADNDNDLDLYCVSGSSEFGKQSKNYQDRFYRNSLGKLYLDTMALPNETSSGGTVTACDYDKDGDLDLFVGGRISPVRYPESPASFLLRNDGKGYFADATPELSVSLQRVGMVTSALWTDFDNDSWIDLILVGEWMPITFYKNNSGKSFTTFTPQALAETTGWWNSIVAGDFDNDGDPDYIAGNLGWNTVYKATSAEPVCVYAKDYDNNGSLDPVLCRYIQGNEYPTHPRETLTDQVASLRRVLQRYSIYGNATFAEIFPKDKLEGALIYRAKLFSSVYIENKGGGNFLYKELPVQAQVSPMFGMVATDFDQDGNLDLLGIGNSYSSEVLSGWYDAGIGICMQGDGKGNFMPATVGKSGFFVNTDAKSLAEIKVKDNKTIWIATSNQDSLKVFERIDGTSCQTITIAPNDVYAELVFSNGKKQRTEFSYGSGYLSQSSRSLKIPSNATSCSIVNSTGVRREVEISKP